MPRATVKKSEETVEKKTPRKQAAPKRRAQTVNQKSSVGQTAPKKTTATKPKKTPKRKVTAASKTKTASFGEEQSFDKKAAKSSPVKRSISSQEVADEFQLDEEELETNTVSTNTKTRKAPTTFAAQAAKRKNTQTQFIVVGVLLAIGIGSSAIVGLTDDGQIDVTQTINDRNARMANMVDVDGPTVVAPRENVNNAPDGGFIGVQTTPMSVPKTAAELNASTTATSTMDVASTSPDGVETVSEPEESESVPAEEVSPVDEVQTSGSEL